MRLRAISYLRLIHVRRLVGGLLAGTAMTGGSGAHAQDASGLLVDPATNVIYRTEHRSVDTYKPETVVSTRPETRTVYTPVVSYNWEPRLANRWNPFVQPTVVYQHTPRMHWESRSETVDRQEIRQVVRVQREEKTDYVPVGKVAPPQQAAPPNSAESAIAARLRPLDANTRIQPLHPTGSIASDSLRHSQYHGGMRANELYPTTSTVYGTPLPPVSGANVAGAPLLWR